MMPTREYARVVRRKLPPQRGNKTEQVTDFAVIRRAELPHAGLKG